MHVIREGRGAIHNRTLARPIYRFPRTVPGAVLIVTVLAGLLSAPTARQVAGTTQALAPGTGITLLPGQQLWRNGVSSYLFGSNDTEEWSADNVQTDPYGVIQSSMKAANATLERTFVFHYSLRDGHRTTIGTTPQTLLNSGNPTEYSEPTPPPNLNTGPGYEVETRVKTIENMGMNCLVVFKDIWTTPTNNTDPNAFHQRIVDPDTGQLETDLDFARKVVAYLGNRCNLYEIGNEPDLNEYTQNGLAITHMTVTTYVQRWAEFVRALRQINPNAKFIGPVTYNDQGNDCAYTAGIPYPTSQPGDCYMRNFLHGVKDTDVEPDAVSFHWYPCDNATLINCTSAQWNSYTTVTNRVRGWIQSDLGHLVPLGITEWNFDPGSNTTLARNEVFMTQFTQTALAAMISANLDFATQFDTQSYGGYGALDMFDIGNRDQPKAQYFALKSMIAEYIPSIPPSPTPTPTATARPPP